MEIAAYDTTATTSHRNHSNGSCFTMNAAISTPGMPPSARPSAARTSYRCAAMNLKAGDRHEEGA